MFAFFESVAYHQLMPWLENNRDEKKFRNILMKMGKTNAFNTPEFFKILKTLHDEKILILNNELIQECEAFSRPDIQPDFKEIAGLFTKNMASHPRLQFFLLLAGHSASASLIDLKYQTDVQFPTRQDLDDNHLPKFLINQSLNVLSDLLGYMDRLAVEDEEETEIIRIMMLAVCVVFFEIISMNFDLYEPFHVNFNASLGLTLLMKVENSGGMYSSGIARDIIIRYFDDGRFVRSKNINARKPFAESEPHSDAGNNPVVSSTVNLYKELTEMRMDIQSITEKLNTVKSAKTTEPPGNPVDDELIDCKEAMKILGINTSSTLNYHRNKGHLKGTKKGNKYIYYKSDVENLAGKYFKNKQNLQIS